MFEAVIAVVFINQNFSLFGYKLIHRLQVGPMKKCDMIKMYLKI